MSDNNIVDSFHAARSVAAVCAAPESHEALALLEAAHPQKSSAHLLWLTWVQWRAMGREAMTRETGLSLWTVNERLQRLREAGVKTFSLTQERNLLARGQFHVMQTAE